MTEAAPKSTQPKNIQGGLAGVVTAAGISLWNHFGGMVEQCKPIGEEMLLHCETVKGPYYLEGDAHAAAVVLIMFAVGPAMRWYHARTEGKAVTLEMLTEFKAELERLREKAGE